jgi:hypothetical protein
MRLLVMLSVLLFGTATHVPPAKAAPWCAYYDAYTYNCGFYSFEQCLATISGVGGACRRNPQEVQGYDRRQAVPPSDEPGQRRRPPSTRRGQY